MNANTRIWDECLARLNSPIERKFLAAGLAYAGFRPCAEFDPSYCAEAGCRACLPKPYAPHQVFHCMPHPELLMVSQAVVGRHRVDFVVLARSGLVAIELDGHDYHDRTKEQARKDRKRDRDLVAEGFKVVRFTGSEVWRDVVAVWSELAPILLAEST